MIELKHDALTFRFPEVHEDARCTIDFQRTLRIPDDNRAYFLPPGLGRFPMKHVDDFSDAVPASWRQHGGVFLPMYQSEALWIHFAGSYPCAVKVAAGKINAVTGEAWSNGLSNAPQDYMVIPEQSWLDGFNVSEGLIRQFVAMPLGEGYTAEEQITGLAEHGGLQIVVYPMKREAYRAYCRAKVKAEKLMVAEYRHYYKEQRVDMGLAPGGLMRQEIYDDPHGPEAWDQENGFRCFVHLANSADYQAITGENPPQQPPSAKDYTEAGLPWFDYYSDGKAVGGSETLAGLSSVGAKVVEKTGQVLAGNEPVTPKLVKKLGGGSVVREGAF